MALTQSARLVSPSWDEEVVPALRKRLESESRTLARRISAISLSSVEDSPTINDKTPRQQPRLPPQDPRTPTAATPRVNGAKPRARTYSSPYSSDAAAATARSNLSKKSTSAARPTRIPIIARGPSSSSTSRHLPDSHPSIELPRINDSRPALLNESPPFPTEPSMDLDPPRTSIDSEEARPYEHWYRGEVSRNGGVGELRVGRRQEMLDIANYGHHINAKKTKAKAIPGLTMTIVGHPAPPAIVPSHRKRADSIAGMTNKEREQQHRSSLDLDDDHVNEVGRVLDENPLTDLELEPESDGYSLGDRGRRETYAYLPGDDPNSPPPPELWTQTAGAHESITAATPSNIAKYPPSRIPGPSSRRSSESKSPIQAPSAATSPRIPVPSSRRSSESKSANHAPSASTSQLHLQSPQQSSIPIPSSSASTSTAPPSSLPTPTTKKSRTKVPTPSQTIAMQAKATNSNPNQPQPSNPAPTSSYKPPKMKNPTLTQIKLEQSKRMSMAYYPTPAIEGDELLEDAIPSWTEPILREGNWDEVVLPVVARKKGLDRYYENANGSPQIKKRKEQTITPAPGTFGFDLSKYRPPRADIEMDEFGQPLAERPEPDPITDLTPKQSQTPLPIKDEPTSPMPSSPKPFAQFASMAGQNGLRQQQQQEEEVKEEVGCCSGCVVM